MNTTIILSLFLSTFFLLSSSISFSPSHTDLLNKCLDDQRSTLLQLQQGLYISHNFTFSSKAELWDLKADCCSWSGVTCDALGHVIGLDLNYKNLSGDFHSVFNLHHLQRLNLAGNNFNTTLFSSRFERLPNLTHLNLTDSCFHGQIPTGISYLMRLVSLDLAYQEDCYWRNDLFDDYYPSLKLEKPNFKTLIKNLRSLEELYLDRVNISTQSSKWCESISLLLPNLRVLSMSGCGLTGPLCSSFSKLHFLSKLNLDWNPISYLPPNFLEISSSLVSLSLVSCNLSGHFPTEVLLLPKMQTVDISSNYYLMGQLPEFPMNNNLQFLSLPRTNFSGNLPKSIGNLKLLKTLYLSACYFSGAIPSSIANLTNLEELDLSWNNFSGNLPKSIGNLKLLKTLYLSGCYFSGAIPSSIANLTNLVELYLDDNNFSGLIPPFHRSGVPNLTYLSLGRNMLSGSKPSSLFTLPSLVDLDLGYNQLVEEIDEFPNASNSLIEYLDLSQNNLRGSIPKSILQLPMLKSLSLGYNNFGSMKLDIFVQLKNLSSLDLSNLSLSTGKDNKSFIYPQLEELTLKSCNLTEFPEFIKRQDKLAHLDLSNNQIHGLVPSWLWKTTLSQLDLSFNAIDFPKDFPFGDANSSSMLTELYLGSCNISTFPKFLKSQEYLEDLDLSNNKISGALPRPICNLSQLYRFNASHNNLSGPIPSCFDNISSLEVLDLQGNNFNGTLPNFGQLYILKVSENKLEGKLPRSLAKCSQLEVLDVGNNMMHDNFPFWLEKLPRLIVLILRGNRFYGQIKYLEHKNVFPALDVLDIASNHFSGELSIDFHQDTQLRSLKIGGNKLKGKLPRSLANCTELEVLDLGNNMFHDAFPFWLEKLPSLKVLILRSNRFYGTLYNFQKEYVFPMLQILDISSNNFSGELSIEFLQCLRAMALMTNGNHAQLEYIGEHYYYQDSVTIVNKGIEIFYQKILTIFTCLDLSNNSFHGRIPEELQILISLKVLNLSQNGFSGHIPLALGNLKDLESLDLSHNKLSGKIPLQLTSLTFLEAINLSFNRLEGSIPQSNQFNTFSNDSYKGNPKLCGSPLSKKCNEGDVPAPPTPREDEESWADGIACWKIALIGYGSGLVIGFCIGYTVLNEFGWLDSITWTKNRKCRRLW